MITSVTNLRESDWGRTHTENTGYESPPPTVVIKKFLDYFIIALNWNAIYYHIDLSACFYQLYVMICTVKFCYNEDKGTEAFAHYN